MQRQFEKKNRKIAKFKFKYYAINSNNASKATIFTTQIKIFTSFELLTNNNLKRKLKYSTNTNRFLSVIETQKNTIANYLIKKSKSNLISLLFISISILIKSSINKVNILQILYKIQAKIEKEL